MISYLKLGFLFFAVWIYLFFGFSIIVVISLVLFTLINVFFLIALFNKAEYFDD
jgi:hypothetical protein